jgi:hypothetical protein
MTEEYTQLSLIPGTAPQNFIAPLAPEQNEPKPVKSKSKKRQLRQGDCVETPSGARGIVMLVSPLGDCYVEVGGNPFIYLQSDLTRLPISVISLELTLHQIGIELYAYRKALSSTVDEEIRASLEKALAVREKFFQVAKREYQLQCDRDQLP